MTTLSARASDRERSSPVAPARLGEHPALDGIRGIAMLGVIAVHLYVPHCEGAGIGVYTFFVLSGFLITRLLLDHRTRAGSFGIRVFYGRRALRLLPSAVAAIAATGIYAYASSTSRPLIAATRHSVVPSLLYYANWERVAHAGNALGLFGQYWSLSVEEQFYLCWPLLLAMTWRRRFAFPVLVTVICVGSLVVRLHTWHGYGSLDRSLGTDEIADTLAIGGVLAAATLHDEARVRQVCRWLVGPAVLYLGYVVAHGDIRALISSGIQFPIEITLVGLASAVLIGYCVTMPRGMLTRLLATPPLAFIGRISYEIYLWHILVITVLLRAYPHALHRPAFWAAATALSLVVAYLSHVLITKPFLRLRRRVFLYSPE